MLISGRFLLKERLSLDAASGREVWAADDTKTGQSLLAHISKGGKIEWYSDSTATRIPSSHVLNQGKILPPRDLVTKTKPLVAFFLTKRKLITAIFLLSIPTGILSYFNWQKLVQNHDIISTDISSHSGSANTFQPHPNDPELVETVAATDKTEPLVSGVKKQIQLIMQLKHEEEIAPHLPDFRRAEILLGEALRSGYGAEIRDSVYKVAIIKADQFYEEYQDKHPGAKEKALAWYGIANAANPTSKSTKQIARLQSRPAAAEKRANGIDYFPKDPELYGNDN